MARKTGALRTGETTVARAAGSSAGAAPGVIAIDNATLSDVNYPAVANKITGGLDCTGFDTIFVGVEVAVPGTSTMTVEPLFYDPDAPADNHLSRLLLGAAPGVTPGALASEDTGALPGLNNTWVELRVFGHRQVFLRVKTVANTGGTTGYNILVRPGRVRGDVAINRAQTL